MKVEIYGVVLINYSHLIFTLSRILNSQWMLASFNFPFTFLHLDFVSTRDSVHPSEQEFPQQR